MSCTPWPLRRANVRALQVPELHVERHDARPLASPSTLISPLPESHTSQNIHPEITLAPPAPAARAPAAAPPWNVVRALAYRRFSTELLLNIDETLNKYDAKGPFKKNLCSAALPWRELSSCAQKGMLVDIEMWGSLGRVSKR